MLGCANHAFGCIYLQFLPSMTISRGTQSFHVQTQKQFLRGLMHLHPPCGKLPHLGTCHWFLGCFFLKTIKPLVTYGLRLLAWKTAFLLAIMSISRVSELTALHHKPPYLSFHQNSIIDPRHGISYVSVDACLGSSQCLELIGYCRRLVRNAVFVLSPQNIVGYGWILFPSVSLSGCV